MSETRSVEVIGPVFSQATFDSLVELVLEARLARANFDSDYVRFSHHNLPPLVDVHQTLTEQASDLFGLRLKPSYVFLAQYQIGGRVPLHIDRDPCYRTIDLMVVSDTDQPWPINIGDPITEDKREAALASKLSDDERDNMIESTEWWSVSLAPNDAVCYSGTHQWHYRPEPATARTDLIFFHFVPEDFDGPLD